MKHIFYIVLFLLSITACKTRELHVNKIQTEVIAINTEAYSNKQLEASILPYKKQLEEEMNEVLAYCPKDMYKGRNSGKAETAIGNFMADLCYKHANPIFQEKTGKSIDFVLLNFGGIRAGIPQGDVTVRTAYEVMPFENSMVVVGLSYEKLMELFTYLAVNHKAHPISKQLQIVLNEEKATKALINGKEIGKKATFYILTSDYLQHGGDRMNFFKNSTNLYKLNYKIRTAILDELRDIEVINAKEDGRMKWE